MKIMLSAFGTRGDIQPFIALGKGLASAGHAVMLCAPETFRAPIEHHGLEFGHIDNGVFDLLQTERGRAAFDSPAKALTLIRQVMPSMRRIMQDEWLAARTFQPDMMVYHPKLLSSYHIAEKLAVPAYLSLPLPFYTPTSAFPNPFFARVHLGTRFNRFSYHLMARASGMYGSMINDFRVRTLALTRRPRWRDTLTTAQGEPVPILYPYSRHVVPVPPDYPPHAHVTGYWFLDERDTWQPSQALERFLASGPPPVYVGFGSMSGTKARERARIVIDALLETGQRGILASGWGGLIANELPPTILMIDQAPHDWLFPHVAAVIHHGGAGTTAAALRAGKPTLICPFIGDQHFWGQVVAQQGVGPQPIPQRALNVSLLATALNTMTQNTTMQQRAETLGGRIRAENGVARAVEIIDPTMRGG